MIEWIGNSCKIFLQLKVATLAASIVLSVALSIFGQFEDILYKIAIFEAIFSLFAIFSAIALGGSFISFFFVLSLLFSGVLWLAAINFAWPFA